MKKIILKLMVLVVLLFAVSTRAKCDIVVNVGPDITLTINDNVSIYTNTEIANVTIYSTQGLIVYQSDKLNINISNFSNGIYIIKIETKDGDVLTDKFIVKH
ncbi:MAG: T9SS type A sorting domain-containing protein [Bacteroidales bacterium]|nr:T9SS type A sorting domain-containing protein [Bacteroidales bacterium]